MKKLILLLFFASCLGFTPAMALTPAERVIVQHVQELNTRQKKELDDVKAKLVWTDKELQDTQPKIDQIGKERDQYRKLYEVDHESLMKADAAILRRNIVIILMIGAIGIYAFLRLYLHLPI
jgi:peptidoglycan hydrolase CwlO-like protein